LGLPPCPFRVRIEKGKDELTVEQTKERFDAKDQDWVYEKPGKNSMNNRD